MAWPNIKLLIFSNVGQMCTAEKARRAKQDVKYALAMHPTATFNLLRL